MLIKRTILDSLPRFQDKLVFIFGPRQSGKTFIVEQYLKPALTLRMDIAKDRISFKRLPDFLSDWHKSRYGDRPLSPKPLVFVDEIHKVRGWRDLIKGAYDQLGPFLRFVASGSSAFKLRKQDKGDSLAGRAVWLNLFPVSFREWVATLHPEIPLEKSYDGFSSLAAQARSYVPFRKQLRECWETYYHFGSFPENLVRQDEHFRDQWLEDYMTAMLDRDLKDLNLARDVERTYQVFQLLLEGMGSTYSLRSLAETLSVSPNTIKGDVRSLLQVMWGFELPAVFLSRTRQIRKEKKFYPIDFCFVPSEGENRGKRFECAVACLVKRALYGETTRLIKKLDLGFYRDYQKREVDLILARGKKILLALECKQSAHSPNESLSLLSKTAAVESVMAVEEPGIFENRNKVWTISIEFLAACLG